jgi:pimeloyl-ACP methyl ester carboxylesterase
VPALFLASEQDRIVPSIHAQRLYEMWAGPKQIHVLANVGHNDIERHDAYYSLVTDFLEQVVIR